jgi:hypothetical protein
MANKTKQQKRVSITKLIVFTMWASIMGLIGVSLPKTINFVNGFSETAFYGNFASYAVSIILFWLFMKDYSLMTERESHFKRLQKIVKKLSEDLRTKK